MMCVRSGKVAVRVTSLFHVCACVLQFLPHVEQQAEKNTAQIVSSTNAVPNKYPA